MMVCTESATWRRSFPKDSSDVLFEDRFFKSDSPQDEK